MEKENYILNPEAIRKISGSSKGTQLKYYQDGFWYKKNMMGYEGKAEALVSKILECSNILSYVKYEECLINGNPGCKSPDFLIDNETNMSFQRLHDIQGLGQISAHIRKYDIVEDRIEYVKDFIFETVNIDINDYLSTLTNLCMLTLNDDCHFNNMSLIFSGNECRPAPIFDNGAALLSNFNKYPAYDSIEENIAKVAGAPFSVNLEKQASILGNNIKIDYLKLENLLKDEPEHRALTVLKMQLEKYKNIFQDKEKINTSEKMEKKWFEYFYKVPKEERKGIEWEGKNLRPAIFTDKYLARCKIENKSPNKEISSYFWNNCVKIQDYTPQFCSNGNEIR